MKKYITFLLLMFLFNISCVYANEIDDDCLKNKTCIALCNYNTKITGNKSRNITIYYHLDTKEVSINHQSLNKDAKIWKKGPGAIDFIFSKDGNFPMYWATGTKLSLSNFVCPANGYYDHDEWAGDNEFCFDNDGKSCKEKYNNKMFTSFGEGGSFVSEKKDYDFADQVSKYTDSMYDDIVDDISSGKYSVKQDLENKIEEDFKKNFLYGYDLPEFIFNLDSYQNIRTKAEEEFDKVKEQEIKKSEKEVKAGTKTEEEHQELVQNWEQASEEVEDAIDAGFSGVEAKITWLADFNVSDYCKSYLGNPEISTDPAYYLQFAFNLIKYASIILLIVLTVADLIKATTSGNQDAIKKVTQNAVKRLIIVVIIFFLPSIIKFLLTILGAYSPGTCGIK